ncbi:hypothetical protein JMG10_38495 [Nostoc ellipsosporum NOK]|nr:hypothetical protein [Nostoc ellipsosporum NOK]
MNKKQITTKEQAREAKHEVLSQISDRPELTGVGISRSGDGYSVKVHLSQPLPKDVNIPSRVNNVVVEAEIVGTAYAF